MKVINEKYKTDIAQHINSICWKGSRLLFFVYKYRPHNKYFRQKLFWEFYFFLMFFSELLPLINFFARTIFFSFTNCCKRDPHLLRLKIRHWLLQSLHGSISVSADEWSHGATIYYGFACLYRREGWRF